MKAVTGKHKPILSYGRLNNFIHSTLRAGLANSRPFRRSGCGSTLNAAVCRFCEEKKLALPLMVRSEHVQHVSDKKLYPNVSKYLASIAFK
jgi:hypothetical protein